MKVLFTIAKYHDRYGADHVLGDVVDYPEHLALKLIGLGYAASVKEPKSDLKVEAPKVETAEAAPPENTAKRTTKPKPRTRKST